MNSIELSTLKNEIQNDFDVFICSSSYEQRCLSVCSNLIISKSVKSFVIFNKEYEVYIKNNLDEQKKILKTRYSLVEASIKNPLLTADNIKENIIDYIQIERKKNILVDTTTFTHETLLILIKLLAIHCRNLKITCIYTSAKEYSVGDDIKNKWLSKGIEEVRAVLGYPGNLVPLKKTHLIVIVGYEYERAISMINILEPNCLSLVYGKSENATVEKDKEANSHYSDLVIEMSPSYQEINKFDIPCNDPQKTCMILEKHIRKHKNENILIAPMNNKISTIGVALLALKNDNLQLCYGPALTYNIKNYSTPGEKCYIFDIDLAKT